MYYKAYIVLNCITHRVGSIVDMYYAMEFSACSCRILIAKYCVMEWEEDVNVEEEEERSTHHKYLLHS